MKYNKDYYRWLSKKYCLITGDPEKLYKFTIKKYGNIPIFYYKYLNIMEGKMLNAQIITKEIDYTQIPTIEEYYKTAKDDEEKKVTECLQKQLKLKPQDKIYYKDMTGENLPAGNYEETSGEAIITGKTYTYFWLEHNKKKGYYLNYTKPIKIIDLDKIE